MDEDRGRMQKSVVRLKMSSLSLIVGSVIISGLGQGFFSSAFEPKYTLNTPKHTHFLSFVIIFLTFPFSRKRPFLLG